jgi:class 3 adenylate cyclase
MIKLGRNEIKPKTSLMEQYTNTKDKQDDVTLTKLMKQSKITKVLSQKIMKKVIMLILSMLMIMPIFSEDFYIDDSNNCYTLLANYIATLKNVEVLDEKFLDIIKNNYDDLYPIVNISISNQPFYLNNSMLDIEFRQNEVKYSFSSMADIAIVYFVRNEVKLTAVLNFGRTIFICFILIAAAAFFESDSKELVLEPLELMIEIVEQVAKDPINARNSDYVQQGIKNSITKFKSKKQARKVIQAEKYEVKIILSAIIKISALLAISFGEAGGEIISENITGNQELNAMLPGKRKTAIFGFCDIRGFADINAVLQEKIMVFINEIADIVHSSVDRFFGSTNKNIGDAFLLVWKFSNNINTNNQTLIELKKEGTKYITCQTMADMAVLSYLKILIRINRDPRILKYNELPEIKEKLLNYKINMGFGLHLGWAIEGAIGSNYKIDPSYLSPNVNMASRLEAATRQYGVSILISGQIYDFLSDDMKSICRLIDVVLVKGSKQPIKLYAIDVNLDLQPSNNSQDIKLKEKLRIYTRKKNQVIKEVEEYEINTIIYARKTFRELLTLKRPKKFKKKFEKGIKYYLEGRWQKAKIYLDECLVLDEKDKPTHVILNYIKNFNYIAPLNWKGCRALTSK